MELKDRLKQARKNAGLTQAELADRVGIKQASVSEIERGLTRTSGYLVQLAQACGVDPIWLSEGTGSPDTSKPIANATMLGPISVWDDDTPLDDDEVYVPFLKEVELSAGSGRTVIEKSSSRKLRFGKQTLRNQGVQFDQAVCVTVRGNSMEPVLPDGSTVGVDKASTAVKDGKMYAIDHGGELRVKTLYRIPGGGLRFRSFNQDEHPDEEYTAQQLAESGINVLGKVFWYSVLL
ncbi:MULTISPECIES: XRE family transcriptional regulator [Pseudomonas]|uniref:XRE family transcriptional regulator n=1 Tax=Pseudomonas TaxID=286 RepID=UPI0006D3E144|nr:MULTISPECIES: helix-turn-helix transcriptional regulator [Pseudomonas]MBA6091632.1 helix-turn-helix transcriptional regulator [Pseudomonas monteilii]MBA6105703.1 helix-turn-helix transcriptional regulator [Pseudomonas monteilii]MCT8191326.1 helix-turn-helix transcriptional regulator [Pseudomonas monteilii]